MCTSPKRRSLHTHRSASSASCLTCICVILADNRHRFLGPESYRSAARDVNSLLAEKPTEILDNKAFAGLSCGLLWASSGKVSSPNQKENTHVQRSQSLRFSGFSHFVIKQSFGANKTTTSGHWRQTANIYYLDGEQALFIETPMVRFLIFGNACQSSSTASPEDACMAESIRRK